MTQYKVVWTLNGKGLDENTPYSSEWCTEEQALSSFKVISGYGSDIDWVAVVKIDPEITFEEVEKHKICEIRKDKLWNP